MMQLRPRLTSASVSPWVATTLPSFTPTMTPQPVPQNRHGAFDHWICSDPNSTLNRLRHRGYGDIGDACGDGGGVRFQHVAT